MRFAPVPKFVRAPESPTWDGDSSSQSWPAGGPRHRRRPVRLAALLIAVGIIVGSLPGELAAQPPVAAPVAAPDSPAIDEDAEIRELATPQAEPMAEPTAEAPSGIDLVTLIGQGGNFMWPIGFMSLLVVTLAVERLVSFRRRRMLPRKLVRRLTELMGDGGESFDPEAAFQACREHRSAAATVIAAMLMRTGRPLGEIEQAGSDAAQREADEHAGPIRWLNLAASATPLMGLLGTVWGMIRAFQTSSALSVDRSRSEQLSEGIYIALVTTLAGLAVAIPAAIIAQYLENRLAKIFHRIEELAFTVAPALERFSGRMRLDADARLRPLVNGAPRTPVSGTSAPPAAASAAAPAPRGDAEQRSRGSGGTTAATSR